MFIANGDGTWTVRFYYNGKADYVTVNSKLPVSGNYLIFDGYGANYSSTSNALWLPLLEKAYVQWNETGKTLARHRLQPLFRHRGRLDGRRLPAGSGPLHRLRHEHVGPNAKTTLISALDSHQAVTLGTVYYPNFNSTGLYGNHAYNVLSYNSSTGKFTLYNPWGC